jgi:hypothetical protein
MTVNVSDGNIHRDSAEELYGSPTRYHESPSLKTGKGELRKGESYARYKRRYKRSYKHTYKRTYKLKNVATKRTY